MLLSSELRKRFRIRDRSRGVSYQKRGKVDGLEVNDGVLSAWVAGNDDDYIVNIDLNDLEYEEALNCSCPRYGKGYLCKHLWAVILEYDKLNRPEEADADLEKEIRQPSRKKKNRIEVPVWKSLLDHTKGNQPILKSNSILGRSVAQNEFRVTEVLYVIDVGSVSSYDMLLELRVLKRSMRKNGSWGQLSPCKLSHFEVDSFELEEDRQIAGQLLGVDRDYVSHYSYDRDPNSFSRFKFNPFWPADLCDFLAGTGRLFWTLDKSLSVEEFHPISDIDLKNPLAIALQVSDRADGSGDSVLNVSIQGPQKDFADEDIVFLADNGIVLLKDRMVTLSNPEAIKLWKMAKAEPELLIKKDEQRQFLEQVAEADLLDMLKLPDTWGVGKTEEHDPVPILRLTRHSQRANQLCGTIGFAYGETEVGLSSMRRTFFDNHHDTWFARNVELESLRLKDLGAFPLTDTTQNWYQDHDFEINKKNLVELVDQLGGLGWVIQLENKPVRSSGTFDIAVESGQDWFDLSGSVDFDGETISLPQVLQAVSRKEQFIVLADGSHGRIPDGVAQKYARLAGFGKIEQDKIRFRPSQLMLLDAKEVKTDEHYRKFRKKLKSFDGIQPKKPPRGFRGELRSYQNEGLGWLHFLRDFQVGGCLADDMGLGKTVQVLSLLEQRRTRRIAKPSSDRNKTKKQEPDLHPKNSQSSESDKSLIVSASAEMKRKPSVVVVPKSLVFNWIDEARKFTPKLRLLNYTGTSRKEAVKEAFAAGGFDVLITTYATMLKDIGDLSQIEFDYAILDESQAIKNSKAQCSKASRLLKADHRLAMTGTPIENHLGELWSLFEFLNPGMLGNSTFFSQLTRQKKSNEADREEILAALSRALKPYLLRRTKEQVLTDLPPKTEQTLHCEMVPSQNKAYKELKEYYRVKLAKKITTEGLDRAKIQVLEALLRLRQVACDPRLVDETAKPGAKLELLQQQIKEVVSEGHKALVFSQFTSLLSLVKQQFDQAGIEYEYLDGQSTKRAASVKRFQEDPTVQTFLISLKAGGHGLNLTAADYVFLLDPWWNPAVEAQAIDRAHRMGQVNPVMAYRLVCCNTVEEKILELQESKRELAEKVISSDESLIRTLNAEDLQFILE